MQKRQLNLQLDTEIIGKLSKMGERYGMTPNTILSAAACELSRVQPENLWHALGRIAEGERLELVADTPEALPAPRKQVRKALPA